MSAETDHQARWAYHEVGKLKRLLEALEARVSANARTLLNHYPTRRSAVLFGVRAELDGDVCPRHPESTLELEPMPHERQGARVCRPRDLSACTWYRPAELRPGPMPTAKLPDASHSGGPRPA